MSRAKVKAAAAKVERVPDALLSAYNAARAEMLQTKMDGEKAIEAFIAERQKAVSATVVALDVAANAIAKALHFKPGDTFSPKAGTVTRGAK